MGKILLTLALIMALGAAPAFAAELVVDDDGADCPNAGFTSIQDAVNAATPGDKVKVCPGLYEEQVTIGAGKDGLRLESQKPLQAIIKAPASMTDPGDIVRVNAAQDVRIRGFVITGPLPDTLFCSTFSRTGVRVDGGGSATIERNHITEIRSTNPALRGCQNGIGILVGRNAELQVGTATIKDNDVDLYQKGGIVVDNAGSSAKIEHNSVTGPNNPATAAAPNGIQVSRGATARVRHNDVTGNTWGGDQTVANGTGILLFQVTGDVEIASNEVFANDDGISLATTTGATVKGNRSHDQINYDGLFASSDSTGNLFEGNRASDNFEHDCHDDSTDGGTAGTGNTWKGNRGVTQTPAGICKP